MDLFTRAREMGIKVQIIHNASIMNACAACGLQLYAFGQTISIPFYNEDWRPDSFYHKMKFNLSGGLHTLCLLGESSLRQPPPAELRSNSPPCADIKVREPDFKALLKGRKAYLPPRYMTINTAIEQLLECEETLSAKGEGGCKCTCEKQDFAETQCERRVQASARTPNALAWLAWGRTTR